VDLGDHAGMTRLFEGVQPVQVVHLAARIDLSPDSVVKYHANIEGVLNLMHAIQRTASVQRVLWTSSQLVSRIGRIPRHDTDYDPDTSYGESKVVTERIVRGLDGGAQEWAILRPTTVWGPGMSDHYVGLLSYLERRVYFHAGAERVPKSFSYIHNATYQIERLLEAPAAAIHRQTFYIADYLPIDLRGWCDALSMALIGRPARLMPSMVATSVARVGDVLNATIAPQFKLNSFRLRNIRTPYVFDTTNLEAVVGPVPHDFGAAVSQTVSWYTDVVKPSQVRAA
jgi:GlcNAc-P-P-Und epimerase